MATAAAYPDSNGRGRGLLGLDVDMTGSEPLYQRIFLKPGELCVSQLPAIITTVLGSCVSLTMMNYRKRVAAMCHGVQPVCRRQFEGCPDHCEERFKFVSCVVPEMFDRMLRFGVQPLELEVKLFGGAAMIGNRNGKAQNDPVGKQNIDAVFSALTRYGISLHTIEVGGKFGRKLIFNTATGEVLMKRIQYRSLLPHGD